MSQPSDTPETDKAAAIISAQSDYGLSGYVRTDFARKLERQRDAAREDARRLAEAIKHSDRFNDTRYFGGDSQLNSAIAAHEALTAKDHPATLQA